VLGPAVLGPAVLGPAVLGPAVLGPAVLGPAVLGPAVLGPAVLGPDVLGPAVLGPAPATPACKRHHYNTSAQIKNIEDESKSYIEKINADIGYYWWKRYIYTAFWSNISTPINLSIIILTALTTGENATQNLIGKEASTILGVAVLFVSIFNTFFQPNEQLAQNKKILADWLEVGSQFDEIYYDKVYSPEEKYVRLKNLEDLFKTLSVLKRANDSNLLIDLLYAIIRCLCLCGNINWIVIKEKSINVKQKQLTLTNQPVIMVATTGDSNSNYSISNSDCSNIHVDSTLV
jgi:hypothetical protein